LKSRSKVLLIIILCFWNSTSIAADKSCSKDALEKHGLSKFLDMKVRAVIPVQSGMKALGVPIKHVGYVLFTGDECTPHFIRVGNNQLYSNLDPNILTAASPGCKDYIGVKSMAVVNQSQLEIERWKPIGNIMNNPTHWAAKWSANFSKHVCADKGLFENK
jgi:hypothetical protein